MPLLTFTLTVRAPLGEVWAFHEDVARALPALSPPDADVRVESADLPVHVGSRIVIAARGPLGVRLQWVARIVAHRPPSGAAAGDFALFVDEQESGPFAAWRHEHRFEGVGPGGTRLTDRVTYRVPLGVLADHVLVRRQVTAMFRHRHEVLTRTFGGLAEGQPGGVHSGA
jgi:ligand-binding SRPBCC domain-containing protein